jgi:MSHA biogenesis protein MshJ
MKLFSQANYWVNHRSDKERIFILIIGFLVVFFLWDSLLYTKKSIETKKTTIKISAMKKEIAQSRLTLTNILSQIQSDPLKSLNEQKDQLTEQIQVLDEQIKKLTSNLVSPEEMVTVIKTLLEHAKGLELIEIKSLPVNELTLSAPKKEETVKSTKTDKKVPVVENAPKIKLYQHGLSLVFSGDFENIVRYLNDIERIKKKIVWNSMHYTVTNYPLAEVTLVVTTISDKRGFIGV